MRSLPAVLLPYLHVVLSVLGLVFLVVAGFIAGPIVGCVTAGLSLLVVAFWLEHEGVS